MIEVIKGGCYPHGNCASCAESFKKELLTTVKVGPSELGFRTVLQLCPNCLGTLRIMLPPPDSLAQHHCEAESHPSSKRERMSLLGFSAAYDESVPVTEDQVKHALAILRRANCIDECGGVDLSRRKK